MAEMRNACTILVEKKENALPGRRRRGWENNIKTDLTKIWHKNMDCTPLEDQRNQ
jgi:hypothetical protein